jgi:hypothetical protein
MRSSLQWIRGAPMVAAIALLAGVPAVHAAGKTPAAHRYTIHGSLEAIAAEKTTSNAPLGISGRLSAPAKESALQSGGDFVVIAKLAESPLGCSGDDTIFADGFDP